MLGVFAARRGVARMYRRIFRVLFAVSVLALTSGCETVSGILAELFGDSPVAAAEPEPQAPKLADRIVVRKSKRTLELLHDGALFESFPIALGREPRGSKQEEGDGRTPEGVYLTGGRCRRATPAHSISHIPTETTATAHER
jgi:murein L,D-transpeptidase YafK